VVVWEYLERHAALELGVEREVHDAHTAARELALDRVSPERALQRRVADADRGAGGLGVGRLHCLQLEYRPRAMCRNIKTLFNFEPPATDDEIRAASRQFVRKLSGFAHPSKPNEKVFERSVEE